jgi:translation initiation factor IF-3
VAVIEQSPLQDGRNMTMLLAPSKAVLAGDQSANGANPAPAEADVTSAAAPTAEAEAPEAAEPAPAAKG